MKKSFWFRSTFLALATLLSLYAGSVIAAAWMRPNLSATDLVSSRLGAPDADIRSSIAARISWDGSIRSDYAALKANQARAAVGSDRPAIIAAARSAAQSALDVSPINPLIWLVLGQLKAQTSDSTTSSLKMSYFTGRLSSDATSARLHTAITTTAIEDEDVRLLAQADTRAILARNPRLDANLVASYRDATPAGQQFFRDAIQLVDPNLGNSLSQLP